MLQSQTVESNTLELLKSLMQKEYLNSFVLVGGTALALQLGNRESIDLDLFSNIDFASNELLTSLLNDYQIVVHQLRLTDNKVYATKLGNRTVMSSETGNYAGYSFAVPVNLARKIFLDLTEYGFVQRGFFRGLKKQLPGPV
mgnify:CR=1 FL=1